MASHSYFVHKTWSSGGIYFFDAFNASERLKIDARSPQDFAEKFFEYARNKLPGNAKIELEFPRSLTAELSVSETGSDSLHVPVTEAEARKIVESYYFFKKNVGMKGRADKRKSR